MARGNRTGKGKGAQPPLVGKAAQKYNAARKNAVPGSYYGKVTELTPTSAAADRAMISAWSEALDHRKCPNCGSNLNFYAFKLDHYTCTSNTCDFFYHLRPDPAPGDERPTFNCIGHRQGVPGGKRRGD